MQRDSTPGNEAFERHYKYVTRLLVEGAVVPFLGAGANLCDRGDQTWEPGGAFLPSGAELAGHLAVRGRYPVLNSTDEFTIYNLRPTGTVAGGGSFSTGYYTLRQ